MFGSVEQVKLAKKFVDKMSEGLVADLDPLINSLRKSLRKELSLEPVDGNVTWVRSGRTEEKKK